MTRLAIILTLLLLPLIGCSGGGSGGGVAAPAAPPPSAVIRTEYWDPPANTIRRARGSVVRDASGSWVREGAWTEWFHAVDGGGINWTRSYRAGLPDPSRPWSEFNADGSLRESSDDP